MGRSRGFVVAAVTCALAASACSSSGGSSGSSAGGGAASSAAGGPITIGVLLPETGAYAAAASTGYLQVAKALQSGKIPGMGSIDGRKVNIVIRDTTSSSAGAASAARQLLSQDHANVVLGPIYSDEDEGSVAVTNAAKVLQITYSACSDCIDGKDFPNVFTVEASMASTMTSVQKTMKAQGTTTVGLIQSDSPTGQPFGDAFTAAARANGITIATTQHTQDGQTDFGTQVQQLKSSGVKAVYLAENVIPDVVNLIKSMAELNYKPALYGSAAMVVPAILQAAGNDSAWVSNWYAAGWGESETLPNPSKQARDFIPLFAKALGARTVQQSDSSSAGVYDSFLMVKAAIEATHKTDGPSLSKWLVQNGYQGAKADYKFTTTDHNGLPADVQTVVKANSIKDGLFERVTSS